MRDASSFIRWFSDRQGDGAVLQDGCLVTAKLARNGLTRHEQGVELYMMVLPATRLVVDVEGTTKPSSYAVAAAP
jgi:hypothetical protein